MKKSFMIVLVLQAVFLLVQPASSQTKVLNKFSVANDIVWANPAGVPLNIDIYSPENGKKDFPVLVIFHGGGWLINNESIMDEMSRYVVEHGDYVVCNVNYRLLTSNNNATTMNQIIEDAMGAVLWIKENIKSYKGDAKRLVVSGDSAGGQLAAMIANAGDKLESDGFAGPSLGFRPTYLPKNKTAEQVVKEKGLEVQAVVLNYPRVDIYARCLGPSREGTDGFESQGNIFWQLGNAAPRGIFGNESNVKTNPEKYKAVSPIYTIPASRKLPPHLICVGSKDSLTKPESVKAYYDALRKAGHPAEYWVYENRPHAYLDSGSNEFLGTSFEKDAPEAIDKIIEFLNSVFKSK